MTYQQILDAAKLLEPAEQVRLAQAIWDDLPPESWPLPDGSWIAEAQRRSADLDAGTMSSSTWEEVRAKARRRAGLDG